MKICSSVIVALSLSTGLVSSSLACTTFLVGSDASTDGSQIIARSADSSSLKAQHFLVHPAVFGQNGVHSSKKHNGANDFTYPLPKNSLRYTTIANWKTGLHGATGFNEAGVGVTGTETIFASDKALSLDPYVEKTGITEDDIADILLSQSKTARDAVKLLGHIVETKGAGEGFGVAMFDNNETWYFETGSGHQWMAQVLPKDVYFVTGNQGRLQKYDPKNPNMLASKNLINFAIEKSLYNPKKDGEFNFYKAYTRNDDSDKIYNISRIFAIQNKFNPAEVKYSKTDSNLDREFSVFLKPSHKISIEDAKSVMRNKYDGIDNHYTMDKNGKKEDWRPISVFRTYEAHVMQNRPWMPSEVGKVNYVAIGMADLSVFVPYYSGLKAYPKNYSLGTDKADDNSVYWKYRKLQTLVMTDYDTLAPIVKKAYSNWEAKTSIEQKKMEKDYINIAKTNKTLANKILNDFNLKVINSAEKLTDELTNEVFTVETAKVDKTNLFSNRGKKD